MRQGRIAIQKIENASRRNITFSKRKTGLLKKAHELGVLCDSQVGVVIFSSSGKLYEYSNVSMEHILARYTHSSKPSNSAADENKPEELKDETPEKNIERLEMEQSLVLEENPDNMNLKELEGLEQKLSETLLLVKERKEQTFAEQLELSKIQEQRAHEENQTLCKQIVEHEPILPSTYCAKSDCVDGNPAENMSANAYPHGTLDCGVEETKLCLGLSGMATQPSTTFTGAEKKTKLQIFRRRS